MKLLILSDLHLEFADFTPPPLEIDIVILAGDVGKKDNGIHWARATWPDKPIIYVAGNHEFYRSERKAVLRTLRSSAAEADVHFLDNDEVVIDGIRFLGCTLWTDFDLFGTFQREACMLAGRVGLNDFRLIYEGPETFRPEDATRLFNESYTWLKTKLTAEEYDGKTVVVTHHLPSIRSVADRYRGDMLSACFASNLDELLGYSELWIHGHTHDSFDYIINGTRVICNPRGYTRNDIQENLSFNPGLILEI